MKRTLLKQIRFLNNKLKTKQEELEKTEYELAKAKADYIEIMRELSVKF